MDSAGRLAGVALVALGFYMALHTLFSVIIGLESVAVSSHPGGYVRPGLYLSNVVVADGTLAGRSAVVVTCKACIHRRIIVFFQIIVFLGSLVAVETVLLPGVVVGM